MTMPAVATLVPHAGAMCLLDAVVAWDDVHIHACATTHGSAAHPLRGLGGLSGLALVEYAAQATAAHGRLLAGARGGAPQAGRLAALRDVDILASPRDIAAVPRLEIHAERRLVEPAGSIYDFRVEAAERPLVRGRLMVKISAVGTDNDG